MKVTIRYLLLRDRMLLSRLGLSVGSALWSLQLFMPVELFPPAQMIAEGKWRQTYAIMATIAPEYVWATLFAIHSLFSLYTLFRGVRNSVTLAADGFLGCILWTTATVSCYAAHWPLYDSWWDSFWMYPTPAEMSAAVVLSFYAWWHMIRFWAEEETPSVKSGDHLTGTKSTFGE